MSTGQAAATSALIIRLRRNRNHLQSGANGEREEPVAGSEGRDGQRRRPTPRVRIFESHDQFGSAGDSFVLVRNERGRGDVVKIQQLASGGCLHRR